MRPDATLVQPDGGQNAAAITDRPMVPTSASDWESKRKIIRSLYMDQNMILNEVIEIMIAKYKFKATARMYKGQFAKWKWTKYNKPGKPGAIKPTRSMAAKKKNYTVRKSQAGEVRQPTSKRAQQPAEFPQPTHLQYFSDEERQVENTLSAYAAMICHWTERECPWRTTAHHKTSEFFGFRDHSILQHVRSAQDCFLTGLPEQGGEMLRRAFLGIETALSHNLDIEALWDCCLAVPQLVLTTGWTDILVIFTRYLHQYTSIKLPHHPITLVAASLHSLSHNNNNNNPNQPTPPPSNHRHDRDHDNHLLLLETLLLRAWHLWIDCSTRIRGRHDDLTLHLKRGYVALVDPSHPMAGDIPAGL